MYKKNLYREKALIFNIKNIRSCIYFYYQSINFIEQYCFENYVNDHERYVKHFKYYC